MNRDLAQTVRERANERCEYCRIPQSALQFRFQIDHIIAEQHGGETVSGISLLRVLIAIVTKAPTSPALTHSLVNSFVYFHPRTDNWTDHFQFMDALLVGKTPVGRATVRVLAMNADEPLRLRKAILQAGIRLP